MYAIIELGGRQWRVEPGTRFEVNRVATDVGAAHAVDRVLLAQDGDELKIGRPYVEGASVVCEVLEHRRGPKVISYHFRRRENWRKTVGHRQSLTRLVVKDIVFTGATAPAQPTQEGPAPAAVKRAPTKTAAKRLGPKGSARAVAPSARPKRGATHGA